MVKKPLILPVNDRVQWIGALDRDLLTFDIVMETKFGTTYNSYLIQCEKKVIVETVKDCFHEEYLEKIRSLMDPAQLDYIVLNHTEPDHSGSLKYLLQLAPNAIVVGSGQALSYAQEMVNVPFKSLKVKDGDTLDIGNATLEFIGAPNLHWPDSIYTYLKEDKILFTCDSFGAHYCDEKMYDDLIGDYHEAFVYYFDVILKPFSKFMLKAIEKIRPLEISTVCTGHGPILRSNWKKIVDLTEKLSREYLESLASQKPHVLITYISAYGYTRAMAGNIAKGIKEAAPDSEVELLDIEKVLLGDLEEKIVKSKAILVGSPTINQNTLLPVYKLFALINPIRDKGKLAASFGSYGWSGEAVKIIESHLKNLKLTVPFEGVSGRFFPSQGKEEQFVEFGRKFGEQLKSLNAELA